MQELEKILRKIDIYVKAYNAPPSGIEVEGTAELLEECRDIIRNYVNDGWAPVEKELPPEPPEYVDDEDDLRQYIVTIDGAERATALRYAGDGTWWEDGIYYPVIAWRPFSKPYRPEHSKRTREKLEKESK